MSKHDSWITLKDNSPFEPIKNLFPDGFPVINPFPLNLGIDPKTGEKKALWAIDSKRLSYQELDEIVCLIANARNVIPSLIYAELKKSECLSISHEWINGLYCGAEGFTRQNEFAAFQASFNGNPDDRAWLDFIQQQNRDWIEGNKEPDPYPQSIEDIHPLLRTPELEQAIENHNFSKFAQQGGYSVFDMLTGDAAIDYLNYRDGEGTWVKEND